MSADVPTPQTDKPPARSRAAWSNRRQVLLFAALTLILTIVTVWGARAWLKHSETLTFAVGDARGPEARFAGKLAAALKNSGSWLRLKTVSNTDNAKALTEFDRRRAALAVLRTDAKVPPRARALAILEHDLVLLISPAGKTIKSLAELKKRRLRFLARTTAPGSSEICSSSATAPTSPPRCRPCRRIRRSTNCLAQAATARRSRSRMPRRS